MMKHKQASATTLLALAGGLSLAGCASRGSVRNVQDTAVGIQEHLAGIEMQIEENQGQLASHEENLIRQGVQIAKASDTALEALERAEQAGKLAQGKFLYEVVLDSDKIRFGFDEAELSEEAADELTAFAERLKDENRDVFLEIQGHTDATGPDDYNLRLGERRAEAVRRHLNMQHQLPLHRMSVISYGEAAPLTPNDSSEQRAQNRRVSIVVLL
jgi:outer membrane protein OmpA-like peptidoglycan-associated protein